MEIITIRFINNDGGGFSQRIDVPKFATLETLISDRCDRNAAVYKILVNGESETADYVLQNGDKVTATALAGIAGNASN